MDSVNETIGICEHFSFLLVYGMMQCMDVKIDKSGRIVVPKVLRDRLGLKPDMVLEVHEQTDGLLLRMPAPQPTMVRIEGLWVHQGMAQANADWARVLDEVRERFADLPPAELQAMIDEACASVRAERFPPTPKPSGT